MSVLQENGKASMGRWFSIIIFIITILYCLAPFLYAWFDKKTIPVAPDILVYMFGICLGYTANSKWADNFKTKFEVQNVDSKPNI